MILDDIYKDLLLSKKIALVLKIIIIYRIIGSFLGFILFSIAKIKNPNFSFTSKFYILDLFIIFCLFFIYIKHRYFIKNISTNNKLVIPNKLLSNKFNEIFVELTEKIDCDINLIKIFINKRDFGISPSIYGNISNEIIIIIPLGFIKILNENYDLAKTIISHEFGHLLQGDINLLMSLKMFIKYSLKLFFVVLILGIIEIVFFHFNGLLIYSLWGIFLWYILNPIYERLEIVADKCAYYLSNGKDTTNAIEIYQSHQKKSSYFFFRGFIKPIYRKMEVEKFVNNYSDINNFQHQKLNTINLDRPLKIKIIFITTTILTFLNLFLFIREILISIPRFFEVIIVMIFLFFLLKQVKLFRKLFAIFLFAIPIYFLNLIPNIKEVSYLQMILIPITSGIVNIYFGLLFWFNGQNTIKRLVYILFFNVLLYLLFIFSCY